MMDRAQILERVLEKLDEAADLVEGLPERDEARNLLPSLEGNSNGGWFTPGEELAWFLRDEVLELLLEERKSPDAIC